MCNELPDFEIQADAEQDYLDYQKAHEAEIDAQEDEREAHKAAMEGFTTPAPTDAELEAMHAEYIAERMAFEHQDDIPEGW